MYVFIFIYIYIYMESENWDSPYEYLIISFRKSPLLIDERAP